jgi:hypothetical protein
LAIRFNLCENCYKSGMHRLPSGESPRRGEARLRGRESCAPLQERERRRLRCARLRRAPRQRRSSPAGASTRSGRASARTLSRCALHDAQPPPSPFVGGGKTAASGARASGAHPDRDAPAPQGLPRAQGGLQPAPSLVARFTTPNLPLRLLWAVGKPPPQVRAPPARTPTETLQPRRGFHALREGFSPHPLSLRAPRRPTSPFAFCGRWENRRLRCARLRRAPRQRRSSPAGASTRSGRASARTLSRCALHDAQPPPSPFVGGGKTAASGARASGAHPGRDAPAPQGLPRAQGGLQPAPSLVARFTTPNLPLRLLWAVGKPPPQVRAPPARTPTETLQPRRGFHALREGFSPLSLVARFTTPNLPLRLLWAVGKPPPQVRAPPARTPTETLQPRRGFHALREGFSPHPLSLRAPRRPTSPFAFCGRWENRRLRCARLRRAPRQRRSSPAGASTRSGRASARTLSRCALHDAQPPPSPFVGGGKTAASGARASGAHPDRDAPAPQGLPRAQGGLQPAPSLVARSTTPNLPLRLLWAVGKPPPQVRAPPARTPTETLQPRRGFHALREGLWSLKKYSALARAGGLRLV